MTATFNSTNNFVVGNSPQSLVVGDFNGDNILDIVTANTNSSNISLLLGDGNGSFNSAGNFSVGHRPFDIAFGDINGDNILDLATANTDPQSNNTSLLFGNGSGGFTSPSFLANGRQPFSIALGDFNNDSNLDITTANLGGSTDVSVILADGTGSFNPLVNYPVGIRPESIAVGDLNNDGNLDIVTANPNSTDISLLLGSSGDNFAPAVNIALTDRPFSISVGDLNGDNVLDLVTANSNDDTVSVLLGTGTGSFDNPTNFNVGDAPQSVAIGDLNEDGLVDLATANFISNDVSILLGDNAGNFDNLVNYGVGTNPEAIEIADFNSDGKLDLATSNRSSNNVSILINSTQPNLLESDYTIFSEELNGKEFTVELVGGNPIYKIDGIEINNPSLNNFLSEAVTELGGITVRNGTINEGGLEHFGGNQNPSIRQNDAADDVIIGGSGVGGQYKADFNDDPNADLFQAFANDLLGRDPAKTRIFQFNGGTNGGANNIQIFKNDEIIELNPDLADGLRTTDSLEFKWSGADVSGSPTTENFDVFTEEMGVLFNGTLTQDAEVHVIPTLNQAELLGSTQVQIDNGLGEQELWDFNSQQDAQNFLNFFDSAVDAFL